MRYIKDTLVFFILYFVTKDFIWFIFISFILYFYGFFFILIYLGHFDNYLLGKSISLLQHISTSNGIYFFFYAILRSYT